MPFSTVKNRNFEKPSRIPSHMTTVNIFKKSDTSQQKIGSAYAQSPRKCSNIEIPAKIERKESNFFPNTFKY